MPRLFAAIDLPQETRSALAAVCHGVNGARWTKPDQLHLTLRFIGEADDAAMARLRAALAAIRCPPLTLRVGGVGTFPPPPAPPKILWAGVAPEVELLDLHQQVEHAVIGCGFQPERRGWQPHITLARMRTKGRRPTASGWLQSNAGLKVPAFEVPAFHLYQSELKPAGPTHTVMQTVTLK